MTPHDALYSAICAQPDEDTPRLAFADLVDEDGDSARAAFIRTQVELARAPEYDPIWAKCRQFDPGIPAPDRRFRRLAARCAVEGGRAAVHDAGCAGKIPPQ